MIARVETVEPGRMFGIDAEALKRLMAQDDAINAAVHRPITLAMGQRLRESDRRPPKVAGVHLAAEAGNP